MYYFRIIAPRVYLTIMRIRVVELKFVESGDGEAKVS